MKKLLKYHIIVELLFCSTILMMLSSCGDGLVGEVVTDTPLFDKLYLNAKDTISIDNQKLVLQTDLYRNFMPGFLPKRRGLNVYFEVVNTDSLIISKKFEVKDLYVLNGKQIWISDLKADTTSYLPVYEIRHYSTDGPEWETGIYVDVVVTIEDLTTSKIYYLIARKQLIDEAV